MRALLRQEVGRPRPRANQRLEGEVRNEPVLDIVINPQHPFRSALAFELFEGPAKEKNLAQIEGVNLVEDAQRQVFSPRNRLLAGTDPQLLSPVINIRLP